MCSRCARYKKHIPLRLTGAKINNTQFKHLARGNCSVGVNSSRSRIYRIKHDEQEEDYDARERFLNPDNLENLENPAWIYRMNTKQDLQDEHD